MKKIVKKNLKDELAKVQAESPRVLIGKNGLTDSLYEEITKQLAQNQLLKIKFLKNYLTENLEADIKSICKKTSANFIEKRGRTIIIYKSKPKERN